MYTYFTQNGSVYKSKRINYFSLGSIVGFGLLAILLLVFKRESDTPYWCFALIPVVINLGIYAHQIVIDMEKGTISTSYIGINRKEYPLVAFSNFEMVHHKAYGIIGDGRDINMLFDIGGRQESLLLYYRLYGKKRIPKIIAELKEITGK